MQDFNRYFVATHMGATQQALSAMEQGGREALAALKRIDNVKQFALPVGLYQGTELIGLTMLPPPGRLYLDQKSLMSEVAEKLSYQFNLPPFTVLGRPRVAINGIIDCAGNSFDPIKRAPDIGNDLVEVFTSGEKAGLNPNIAITIARFNGKKASDDLLNRTAVLTINDHKIYPKARRLFADWIIILPPYIEQHGNEYEPPACTQITAEELTKRLTLPKSGEKLELNECAHDHEAARIRLLGLPKLNLRLKS